MNIPVEFKKIARLFSYIFDEQPCGLDKILQRAAEGLQKHEKKIVAGFIDECFANNYNDEVMSKIWKEIDSGLYIENEGGVKYFLAEFRKHLL